MLYTVTDSKTGINSEGVDTLINVELAQFSNGLFEITSGGFVAISSPPPPTNTPGSVIISGIASTGNILTAKVSDPDGISGTISYQWQSSSDNGATWNSIGNNSNSYTVTSADIGTLVQATAFYIDDETITESPVSTPKTILDTQDGDLVVTLMQLKAPLGASTINPLTTLVQNAIELGLSPNMATLAVTTILSLPDIKLQSYDAYAILQTNPTELQALVVEKVAVQVAILTSLSDDDTGLNLTSAIINAAANNQTLDLANVDDLSVILGIPAVKDPITQKYPQPLHEILDRNQSMSEAIADGGDVSDIEKEWQDLLSIQDGIASTSIADLSIHINQTPMGTATASLAQGTEGSPYLLKSTDLLLGFSDPDGGNLSVTDLAASIAGTFTSNSGNTWTFAPPADYTGPVELTYTVLDGQGGSLGANQLFVLVPVVVPEPLTFTGTTKADNLTGTTEADKLIGLGGNDTYTVNNIGDIVVEDPNGGTDTVKASVSYTLPNNVEQLTLTDSTNLNGTGNVLKNKLTGNTGNNILDGGAGADTLTGGNGVDTFLFRFGESTASVLDRVTDFAIDTDKIDLLTQGGAATGAPSAFTRAANSTSTKIDTIVTNVFADANGATSGNQPLGLNSAVIVKAKTATYLIVNDNTAGFQSTTDLVINLTGITGTLPALGSIPVSSFFI